METKVTYLAADVHSESLLAQWGRPHEKPHKLEVPYTDEGIQALIGRVGTTNVCAVYEASGCGFILHDKLTAAGWKVFVLAPTHIEKSQKRRKRKTDDCDVDDLFRAVMAHGELGTKLPAVWAPDVGLRADRETGRRRLQLGERISQVKAGIGSLLLRHGVRRPEQLCTPWSQKHMAWLRGLTGANSPLATPVRAALESVLRELEFLREERERVQQELETLAEKERYRAPVDRLCRNKGIGILTAMVFLLEIGDPNRFKNRRQVGAYLGLTPMSFESGKANDRKGHITRLGPPRLRKILNQAAWGFLKGNPDWKGKYRALAKRRGKKRAIVAIMRKLGIRLWRDAAAA